MMNRFRSIYTPDDFKEFGISRPYPSLPEDGLAKKTRHLAARLIEGRWKSATLLCKPIVEGKPEGFIFRTDFFRGRFPLFFADHPLYDGVDLTAVNSNDIKVIHPNIKKQKLANTVALYDNTYSHYNIRELVRFADLENAEQRLAFVDQLVHINLQHTARHGRYRAGYKNIKNYRGWATNRVLKDAATKLEMNVHNDPAYQMPFDVQNLVQGLAYYSIGREIYKSSYKQPFDKGINTYKTIDEFSRGLRKLSEAMNCALPEGRLPDKYVHPNHRGQEIHKLKFS